MTPISNYKSTNDVLRLLLQGPSGAGKTTVASQFPGAYIIDIDVNLGGTLRFLKEHNLTLPVGFDVLDKDDQGNTLDIKQRYTRFVKCIAEAQANEAVKTVIIDSGTGLSDIMIAEVCRQQGKNSIQDWKDGRQFWNLFAVVGRDFMTKLTAVRKHIILIVHEKTQYTDTGAVVYPIKVAWPGQVGQNIGLYFTNVWRCEVEKIPAGLAMNYKWWLRTMPDSKYELKNTLGLPPKFEFSWPIIEEALNK